MDVRRLSPGFAVSGQIGPGDLPKIAAEGFRTVICVRPDGEDPGQPPAEEIRRAAEAAGLAFRHIPVVSGRMGEADVAAFSAALDAAPGPALAYCRSGGRAGELWSRAGRRR